MRNKQGLLKLISLIMIGSTFAIYKFQSLSFNKNTSPNKKDIKSLPQRESNQIISKKLNHTRLDTPDKIKATYLVNFTKIQDKPLINNLQHSFKAINNSDPNIQYGNNSLIGGSPNLNLTPALNHKTNSLLSNNNNYFSNSNALTKSSMIMYVGEFSKNQITACQIMSGTLINCKPAITGIPEPEGLLIINNKLYILNMNNNLTICSIDNQGHLSNCNTNAIPINYPAHLAFDGAKLYITDFDFYNLLSCSLDNIGNIAQCNSSTMNNIVSLFTVKQYNSYSYLLTNESTIKEIKISKCNINNTSCQLEQNNLLVNIFDFNLNAGYAYMTDLNNSYLVSCNIDSNGDLIGCNIANNLVIPTGMVLYTINSNTIN